MLTQHSHFTLHEKLVDYENNIKKPNVKTQELKSSQR